MDDVIKQILKMLEDNYNSKEVYLNRDDIILSLQEELNIHKNELNDNIRFQIALEVNNWLSTKFETQDKFFTQDEIDAICLYNDDLDSDKDN